MLFKVTGPDLFHVFAHPRDDVDALFLHLLRKVFAKAACVGIHLAEQFRNNGEQSLAAIGIARRDLDGDVDWLLF